MELDFVWTSSRPLFPLLFKSWGTIIDAIGGSMDFVPVVRFFLVYIYVIFFFRDVLNSPKKEDIAFEGNHRMSSSWLNKIVFTSGQLSVFKHSHCFLLRLNFQKSFKVFCPLVPPKMYRLPLFAIILKLDRGSGSAADTLPS